MPSGKRLILKGFAAMAASWFLAVVVMFNDIDFFTMQDLFDTTELHHEHIVVGLLVLGVLLGSVPLLYERRQRRGLRPGM